LVNLGISWQVAAGTLLLLPVVVACGAEGPVREVTLVARGMTFVLEGAPDQPNPPLALRAGERVRLVLKNEAPGLLHDFEIPALNIHLDQIRAGESIDRTFTVPDNPGRHDYRCRPHAELMHGVVEVTR
jgi:plastocyanin